MRESVVWVSCVVGTLLTGTSRRAKTFNRQLLRLAVVNLSPGRHSTPTGRGGPASPLESFLFLQVGSGAARSPRSLAFASVTVREAATSWAHGDGYSGCARQGADLIGAAAANWQG